MQRSLSELDPSRGTIDELVITLANCKHAFTVETLDGHCSLHDYYVHVEGSWKGLKAPETGFKVPPTCPTCRSAIRSPRYGRVYKRADLDILERNVTSELSTSLQTASVNLDSIDSAALRRTLRDAFCDLAFGAPPTSDDEIQSKKKARMKVLNCNGENPVAWEHINPRGQLHEVKPDIAQRWTKEVKHIGAVYQAAIKVASTRSAHSKAWESAFSSLYRQEIDDAVEDPTRAPRHPKEYAMRMANMKVGQPKPRADKRFCVEAIWLTLRIRLLLVDVASEWLTPVNTRLDQHFTSFKESWIKFIKFVLETCERDARVAMRIATASESIKQALRSKVFALNSRFEAFKFNFRFAHEAKLTAESREELAEQICKELASVDKALAWGQVLLRMSRSAKVIASDFASLFYEPINAIREEWMNLERSIRMDTVYNPVSYEEKKQIVAALRGNWDFTHSGHFYQCPNGHSFIITECGGAMQTASCPECGEAIGGSNYNLISSNRRDTELEAIAREHGAQASPWP